MEVNSLPSFVQDPRYRMLDVWRGLACLMIVVHHAGYALESDAEMAGSSLGAWTACVLIAVVRRFKLGVPLFFVVSGYCIAASVDAARRQGASPWEFLCRRVRRIYPPYWAAIGYFVAAVVVLDGVDLGHLHRNPLWIVLDSPWQVVLSKWVGNLTLTETLRPHLWGPARDVYTAVAWSLCYEEQFYLVCFLALFLVPRRLSSALATVSLIALGLRLFAWWTDQLDRLSGTFPMLWHQFAVGLVVYYRLVLARSETARRATAGVILALLGLGYGISDQDTITAAAFGLLLIALRAYDERASSLAWLAPLRACGRRCYSIYLAHLPVCIVVCAGLYELGLRGFWSQALLVVPLATVTAVASSWVFFALVESRFLNPPMARSSAPYCGTMLACVSPS
jgi:peptidoglycan/LPS O-acetylase OafA/YrhL